MVEREDLLLSRFEKRPSRAMKGGVDRTKTIVVSSCDSASYRSVLQWSTVATAHRAGSGRCESVRSKEWFVREYLSMTKMLQQVSARKSQQIGKALLTHGKLASSVQGSGN